MKSARRTPRERGIYLGFYGHVNELRTTKPDASLLREQVGIHFMKAWAGISHFP